MKRLALLITLLFAPAAHADIGNLTVGTACGGDSYEIDLLEQDGTPVRSLFACGTGPAEVSWSPDGGSFTYEDAGTIQLADAERASTVELAAKGFTPAFHPDGEQVSYWAGKFGLQLVRTDGTDRRRLAKQRRFGPPVWARDGSVLAFKSSSSVRLLDGETGELLGKPAGAAYQPVDWSPKGELLLIRGCKEFQLDGCKHGLYTLEPDGGRPRRLAGSPRVPILDAAWAPDGSRIAYIATAAKRNTLATMSARGTKPATVLRSRGLATVTWQPTP